MGMGDTWISTFNKDSMSTAPGSLVVVDKPTVTHIKPGSGYTPLLPQKTSGVDTPKTYNSYDEWWGETGGPGTTGGTTGYSYVNYSKCHHWRQQVQVAAPGVLLASGHQNTPKGNAKEWGDPYPSLGIYLSNYWLEDLGGIATVGIPDLVKPLWPFVTITWPDYGTVNQTYYSKLIELACKFLEDGKTVEVACQAGHGRTGTMLAGIIATIEGLGAKDALDTMRSRYCKEAVESYGQEAMLYTFLGEEMPPKQFTSYATYTCICGHSDSMHGLQVNGPDYKTGVCVTTDCTCGAFVDRDKKTTAKTGGSLKPCACGHSKSKHRGHDRVCVKCNKCTGYVFAEAQKLLDSVKSGAATKGLTIQQIPLPQATKDPVICVCGHMETTHWQEGNAVGTCKLCLCEHYINSDTVADAELQAYTFKSRWNKTPEGMRNVETGETWVEFSGRVATEELQKAGGVPGKEVTANIVQRLVDSMTGDAANYDEGVIPD